VTDGSMSFVMFHYGNLTWTTGVMSGGDPITGIGGNAAAVSYNLCYSMLPNHGKYGPYYVVILNNNLFSKLF